MKPEVVFSAGDEVQGMIQDLGRCLHRTRLPELRRLSAQVLRTLERTADGRHPAFKHFLGLLESGVETDNLALTLGALSAVVALGQCATVGTALRFGQPALPRAA